MKYLIISYYHFAVIEQPEEMVRLHKNFFRNKDFLGRIYISHEGINGQISAPEDLAKEYMQWMQGQECFTGIWFKGQLSDDHAFDRMTVKFREQLVAFDVKVDLTKRGKHVAPEKWKQMLEERSEDTILIDVRNEYEAKVGHFEGAKIPPCDTFREFPNYTEQLKKEYDPKKTKVMMYCTGGIRCEYYSAYLQQEGFKNIYQLEGGVVNYGQKMGSDHWKGKLFVFDDRLTVPISEESSETISHCKHCGKKTDHYFNCANMDCNSLFLSCEDCLALHKGCCDSSCTEGRVREFHHADFPKPFRRCPFEEKQKYNR